MKDREFRGNGDNYSEAKDLLEDDNTELEPTGDCVGNDTLQSFEARDFNGKLIYFVELNFEDMVYARVDWKDGEMSYFPYDVIIRKWVVIDGRDREYGYERTYADTAAEASMLLHRRVAEFASDRFENYDY